MFMIAYLAATLFTGAAVYVSVAEHPARLTLDDAGMLAQWKVSYARGFIMQASLAVIAGIAGLISAWQLGSWLIALGSVLILANWPYTLMMIMPVNTKLNAPDAAAKGTNLRALMNEWGRLHTVRAALGAACVVCYALATY